MQTNITDNKYTYILAVFKNSLASAMSILNKSKAHASEKGISDADFLDYKLADDMYNFAKQIQIVSDNAKTAVAKLSGTEVPSMSDVEVTFDELIERIKKTQDFVNTFTAESFADADNVKITFGWLPGKYIDSKDYIEKFLISNLYFHVTTAYAISRSKGVNLGKMDYIATDLNFKDIA